ncbi:MAG TPA: hypothetical protein VLZ12_07740 [Verrucomicrobiae bacterium]|nr:hypothetical protein [Verrucomicrobiae bacterium]
MNRSPRPTDAAPGGMRGATRMHDPSEVAQDRVRRRTMNVAFVIIVVLNIAQVRVVGVRGWDWLSVLLLVIAAAPLGLAAKVFELRFKMANEERARMLRELPRRKEAEWAAYAVLATTTFAINGEFLTWPLAGVWLYDFWTYYHDRPERMRHVYAVAKTLDELRGFPVPWAWTLPALAWEICRRL